MTTVTIPAPVGEILKTLEAAGYGAWCVGGCVRDALLDRMPGDWDVTTSARPEETMALFAGRAVPTGLRHGTVQQRPYHSRLGEEFHTAAFHLRAEQRPHAERGIHFYLLAVDGLRKVVFQYRATGAGAH